MDYINIASLAGELNRIGVVAPYEFKLRSKDFSHLMYHLQHFYPDRFIPGEILLVRTTYGNVIIREVE